LITNPTEWTITAFAAAKTGALVAAISTFSTPRELAWAVEHSGAATLITLDVFRGQRFLDAMAPRRRWRISASGSCTRKMRERPNRLVVTGERATP
jgi:long-subunit acyl-CoA synthetase (AMP-forming)